MNLFKFRGTEPRFAERGCTCAWCAGGIDKDEACFPVEAKAELVLCSSCAEANRALDVGGPYLLIPSDDGGRTPMCETGTRFCRVVDTLDAVQKAQEQAELATGGSVQMIAVPIRQAIAAPRMAKLIHGLQQNGADRTSDELVADLAGVVLTQSKSQPA